MKYELWIGTDRAAYSWILARSSYIVHTEGAQVAAVAWCVSASKQIRVSDSSLSVLTQNYTIIK